jgi:hypothetical protein
MGLRILVVTTEKVKVYNSCNKVILKINGNNICILSSEARASECIQYLYGYEADINDGNKKVIR